MKTAIVYDRINKWGGAERVLLSLHKIFPDAPLYTSVYNKETALWAKNFTIKTSFLQNFPKASSKHEMLATLMPLAFESFVFDEYDLIISVTSEAAKGIITKPGTRHICICLTPTRYLWSGYDIYFTKSFFKYFSLPFVWYLKKWDKAAAQRPDAYIAISQEVQKRIKKYYGRESALIYPAVTLRGKGKGERVKNEGFFLVVSRMVPYKRIDLAVKACTALQLPLKIIGSGSEEKKLRQIAGPTIEFLGTLTDKELAEYYRNCSALLFPGIEDFGITVVEAQQFGKPVIGFKAGGAAETIIEGKTGEFFYPQTTEKLMDTLQMIVEKGILDPTNFSYNNAAIENAVKYSFEAFKKNLLREIDIVMKK